MCAVSKVVVRRNLISAPGAQGYYFDRLHGASMCTGLAKMRRFEQSFLVFALFSFFLGLGYYNAKAK